MSWLNATTPAGTSGSFATQAAEWLFFLILGGGLFTGLANFIKARSSSRRVKLDTDPNSPRVAIGGAETAVTLMGLTLKSLQGENERQAKRIADLEEAKDASEKHADEQDQKLAQAVRKIDDLEETVRMLKLQLGVAPA